MYVYMHVQVCIHEEADWGPEGGSYKQEEN